jgi:hypothetical protein
MATELTEQSFPLNFSDAFRPFAAAKLLEEMATADTWSVREIAFCAYQTLDGDDVETFAMMLCNKISDREAVIEIVESQHDWWKYHAVLTAPRKRQMPELCLHLTSDHLFQIVRAMNGYVKVHDLPEEWQDWYKHDALFAEQEDNKVEYQEYLQGR